MELEQQEKLLYDSIIKFQNDKIDIENRIARNIQNHLRNLPIKMTTLKTLKHSEASLKSVKDEREIHIA